MTYESAEAICREVRTAQIYFNFHGLTPCYAHILFVILLNITKNGLEQSHPWTLLGLESGPCGRGIIEQHFSSWSDAECSIYVKIAFDSGNIAIVHDPQRDYAGFKDVEPMVREDSMNFFKAFWLNGHPSRDDCQRMQSCYLQTDQQSCICKVGIHDSNYFTSSEEFTSISNIYSTLRNGAVDPETFDEGFYINIGDCGVSGLTVYSTADGRCNSFTQNTIFSLSVNGVNFFLKNMKSIVYIQGDDLDQTRGFQYEANQRFAFRNPPHFINMIDPATRDIIYETEAVIDSLFYHPNHPTFLAIRLIQRFGISNPSPDFIVRVAEAYTLGSFRTFGSGQYGDLGAMVAALLLDPESRNTALDLDQVRQQLSDIFCW